MPPKWRHALPPTPVHGAGEECTHVHGHTCTSGRAPPRRKCNACITRTSTMMSGEFAPGGTRMYARGDRTLYLLPRRGRRVGFLVVRKCAYTNPTDTWEILRAMESPLRNVRLHLTPRERRRRIIIADWFTVYPKHGYRRRYDKTIESKHTHSICACYESYQEHETDVNLPLN